MDNGIQVFEQSGLGSVRVVMQGGEPWFVAKDVCECLDIGNSRDAVSALDEDEKGVDSIDTPGGVQEMSIISEPGLYSLILRSRKPDAKAFKRWVTHDILPSIRKTGGYGMAVAKAEREAPIQGEVEAAILIFRAAGIQGNQLALAADKYYKRRIGVSALEAAGLELVAPQQKQLLTPTQIGKELGGISGRKVNLMLAGLGLQRRVGEAWEPTEAGTARGGVLMDTGKQHSNGTPVRQLKWPSDVVAVIQ